MFSRTPNEITSLKSKKAIELLFAEGVHIRKKPLKLVYRADESESLALGFGVSKRLFPKAVDRNRIKRLMREQFKQLRCQEDYSVFFGVGYFVFEGKMLPSLLELKEPMRFLVSKWSTAEGAP
jgi:ribonuclease P protein component